MIKGHKINLRHVQADELNAYIQLANNLEFKGEFTRTLLRSPTALKRDFELNGFVTDVSELFVIVNENNEILGTIGHFATVQYSSARELGFTIFGEGATRQGVATEAVRLITQYLFHNFPINRMQICMPVGHIACEKVATNCGYTREGIIRGSIFVRGKFLDTTMYSMLRSEFEDIAP